MPEVPAVKKRIQIQGFLIFLAVVILAGFYKFLLPVNAHTVDRIAIDIIGGVLFLSGYLFRTVARGYKAELNPDGKILVRNGPYAITRNPMYLGTLFIGLGIILLILRWWVAVLFLTVYLIIYLPQIKKEEKRLQDFFGGAFKDYCQKTPKFFPTIRSLFNPDSRIKLKASWVKKESASFIAALIFVAIVKLWELFRL